MANEISTAGSTLQYAVELAAGVRPLTGYTIIPGCRTMPDFNPTPETLEVTDLSDEEFRRYIPALRSVGDATGYGFSNTPQFREIWGDIVDEFETARESGLSVWFAQVHTKDPDAYYFTGEPITLGSAARDVGEVLVIDAYIVPNLIDGWHPKPTT